MAKNTDKAAEADKAKAEAEALATAQALEAKNQSDCKAVCVTKSKEIHVGTHKDAAGKEYKTYTRCTFRPVKVDGVYSAIETGKATLVPSSAIPDSLLGDNPAKARLEWDRVKRTMAQRMVLHPGMTVDAIGVSRDGAGRNKGLIRVIESSVPIRAESGTKLLSEVQKQLDEVKL